MIRLSSRAQCIAVSLGLSASAAGLFLLAGCSSSPSPAPELVFSQPANKSAVEMGLDESAADRSTFGPNHYCTFTEQAEGITTTHKFVSRGPDAACELKLSTTVTAAGDFGLTHDLVLEELGKPQTVTDEQVIWKLGFTTFTLTDVDPLTFTSRYDEGELQARLLERTIRGY